MNNAVEQDKILSDLLHKANAPLSISSRTGENRSIQDRVNAIRAESNSNQEGSCYSHSSWGN